MPEYLSPGVYVEEIDVGPKPIEGVSTSNAGFVGRTVRGPLDGLPVLITSFPDFRRNFGGYLLDTGGNDHYLAHAVRGFLENGGKRVFIRRVANTDIATAAGVPTDGIRTRLRNSVVGNTGPTSAGLADATGIAAGDTLDFYQRSGGVTSVLTRTLTTVDAASNTVSWDVADNYQGTVTYDAATTLVTASGLTQTHIMADIAGGAGVVSIELESVAGLAINDVLAFVQRVGGVTTGPHQVTLTGVNAGTNVVDWAAADAPGAGLDFAADATLVFLVPAPPLSPLTTLSANIIAASFATSVRLASLRGIDVGTQVTLRQDRNGVVTGPIALTVTAYDAAQNSITWAVAETPPAGTDFEPAYTTVTVLGIAGATPVRLAAANGGAWGNDIAVQITHTSLAAAEVVALSEATAGSGIFDVVELNHTNRFYTGAIVEFDRGQDKEYARVVTILGNNITIARDVDFAAATDLDPQGGAAVTMARTCEFSLTAEYDGVTETHAPLVLDDNAPYFYENTINNNSRFLTASGGPVVANNPFAMPSGVDGLNVLMSGGLDGSAPTDAQYIGQDNGPGNRTGLQSMIDIDEVSIVAIPGITSQTVHNALITHCETLLDRFAILDPDYRRNTALNDIQTQRNNFDTRYAALYFPRIQNIDVATGTVITLPPSGHIAGIYARTDIERGVHKAPGNVVVQGITGLDLTISKGEQDILNPQNINVIRDFRADGRGIRVWGARCITSDSAWRYVPVRRLFIFVEESLDEGLQWVVFEPNDHRLWARVRQTIGNFLTRVWRDGALMGTTPEQAFFVLCDLNITMTQDDIDNGRLIVQVGIAPVKPAEFVIIRIQQYTREANVT